MQKQSFSAQGGKLVILATGGTIAGTAASPTDNTAYVAAQLGVQDLVAAVPGLQALLACNGAATLVCEQLAQIDSKDMSHAVWQALAQRVAHHLDDSTVRGVVITHGTDTLEETAYLLHRVVNAKKPVVLTAAMRPATSLQADGPQNLLDACSGALADGVQGVLVAFASQVWAGAEVRKSHTFRLDAFDGGDASPLARVDDGVVVALRPWPGLGRAVGLQASLLDAPPLGVALLEPAVWPRVHIVLNHAGADGTLVDALLGVAPQAAQPLVAETSRACLVDGLVVAGTGNCTLHHDLEAALCRAEARGVRILRVTRVARGGVREKASDRWPSAGSLTPAQARVELLLQLMAERQA